MSTLPNFDIRPLEAGDADGWVRCRLLSLLGTSYFDDVKTGPTALTGESIRLVALANRSIVGLIDVDIDDHLATIDSIAVLPEWQGGGIATAMLGQTIRVLPFATTELDAWTRDDAAANAWYRANGFISEQHYLHVYKSWDDITDAELPVAPKLTIVGAFMHASLDGEDEMRRLFRRVHVCRRYVRPLRN